MRRLLFILMLPLAVRAADVELAPEPIPGLTPRPGCVLPVRVQVTVRTSRCVGTLEATTDLGPAVIVREPVEVGSGTFVYWLYPVVYRPATVISLRLRDAAGADLAVAALPISWPFSHDVEQSIAVVSPVRAIHLPEEVVRVPDQELLPDHWIGYDAIEVVIWDAETASQLTAVQQEALYLWLLRGGLLLIATRRDDVAAHSPIPRYLPAWPNRAAIPAYRRMGDGGIYHTVLREGHLLQYLDVYPGSDWRPFDRLPLDAHARLAGDLQAQAAMLDAVIDRYRPDLKPIVRLGLVYLLVVSAADYLLLRRHRQWTWLTFPLAIAGFTVFAWYRFHRDNPWEFGAQITCVDRLPHTDMAIRTDISRWVLPAGREATLELPPGAVVTPCLTGKALKADNLRPAAWTVLEEQPGKGIRKARILSESPRSDLLGLQLRQFLPPGPPPIVPHLRWLGMLSGTLDTPAPDGRGLLIYAHETYPIEGQRLLPPLEGNREALARLLSELLDDNPMLKLGIADFDRRLDLWQTCDSLLSRTPVSEAIVSLGPAEAYVLWVGVVPRDLPAGPGPHLLIVRDRLDLSSLVEP